MNKSIIEIAVRIVKDGQKNEFETARANFIEKLTSQEGVSNDREFQSFYALPKPDEKDVFIGMTEYAGQDTIQNIQNNGEVMGAFGEFAKTMDLKAYVFAKQTEGKPIDLATLAAQEGQILEVGVRRMHKGKDKEFNEYRKQFVDLLSSYEGVLESYEFAVVAGQDTENLSVGMTVYKDKDSLMKLIEPIMKEEVTGKYFSTFDVVASQFAFSIK